MEAGDGRTGGGGSWWSKVLSWWVAVGGVEGGRGGKVLGAKKKFWGEIEMTLGDLKISREGEE
jgi:hypothetical protein